MRKFCFLCGKKTEDLIKSYCEECYIKKHGLASIPKRIEILSCPKCDLAKIKMKWKKLDVEKVLKSKIKTKSEIKDISVKAKKRTPRNINNVYEVTIKGYLPGSKKIKVEKILVNIHLNKRICEACSKMLSGYYEASIQLRYTSREARFKEEKIIRFICKEMDRMREIHPMAFYSIEKEGRFLDFLIGSKKAAEKMAILLKRKYKAKIKKSYTLVTQKDGRDVYRNTFSVRI